LKGHFWGQKQRLNGMGRVTSRFPERMSDAEWATDGCASVKANTV